MFSTSDTIVAIATPLGRGGIGVVRLSGPGAIQVARGLIDHGRPLLPRRATLTRVNRPDSSRPTHLDQVIVTYFPIPASYTGDEVVEISAHGSPVVLREIVKAAVALGARLAEPGEFTLRAFLNGRIDLVQAEAVADLVEAVTPLQARVALDQLEGTLTARIGAIDERLFDLMARMEASVDFPEEGYHFVEPADAVGQLADVARTIDELLREGRRGRLIREGRQVAIIGKPNVGKSSLFNYLVGAERAIVTAQPGTTRDLVTELTDLGGLPVTFVDTAGLHQTVDVVESEGMRRARGAAGVADLVLLVLDRSMPLDAEDEALLAEVRGVRHAIIVNKTDLPAVWTVEERIKSEPALAEVSLLRRHNVDALGATLRDVLLERDVTRDEAAISNVRHLRLLERTLEAIKRARSALNRPRPESEDVVLVDLQDAKGALEEITGRRTSEDTLRHIFERFCIGK